MARLTKLIAAILFLNFVAQLQAEDLKSGRYVLEMDIPAMAEGKKQTKLEGELKSADGGFTFDTKGATGNPVTFHGKLIDERIVMWVSSEEKGEIVTFHLTGERAEGEGAVAAGELSIFTRHEKAATGTWNLRAKK